MKLGIAVLGVGRWGVHFVRNFLQHPQTELVAVVDKDENNLTRCREKFDLDSSKVLLTTHWEKVKQLTNLDAVVVATPATTHYSVIKDALLWGYHVLAEKPLTLDDMECVELTELAAVSYTHLTLPTIYSV